MISFSSLTLWTDYATSIWGEEEEGEGGRSGGMLIYLEWAGEKVSVHFYTAKVYIYLL